VLQYENKWFFAAMLCSTNSATELTHQLDKTASLLNRVAAFLPQMAAANEQIVSDGAPNMDVVIEPVSVDDDEDSTSSSSSDDNDDREANSRNLSKSPNGMLRLECACAFHSRSYCSGRAQRQQRPNKCATRLNPPLK
jgi:hypothetical protein